jgi:hypothetical protein
MQADNTTTTPDDIVSILFILDESGSMEQLGKEPIQSMRSFYKTQQETGKEFLSTFITFSDKPKFVHKNIMGSEIEIKDDDFKPDGMTALYDAIGTGIDYQKNIKTKNVICVILTDGHENSSRTYRATDIRKLTTEMEKEHKWVFIYLGANQDSFAVSESLGINPTHSGNYAYTPEGFSGIMRGVSDTVSRCVSHDVTVENFVPEINSIPNSEISTSPTRPSLTRTFAA